MAVAPPSTPGIVDSLALEVPPSLALFLYGKGGGRPRGRENMRGRRVLSWALVWGSRSYASSAKGGGIWHAASGIGCSRAGSGWKVLRLYTSATLFFLLFHHFQCLTRIFCEDLHRDEQLTPCGPLCQPFCFTWKSIIKFYFSPQIAVRLLAHKIQSPQEWEAIQALTVGLLRSVFLILHLHADQFRNIGTWVTNSWD